MKLVCVFILLSCLLCSLCDVSAQTSVIPLATGEWEPYTSEKMSGFGAFTEVVTAAFKEMGMAPQYKFYPWKRAETMVKHGKVFAVFPYIINEERKKTFEFSDPVVFSTGRFFYLKKNYPKGINYNKFEDLAPYTISGVLGYWYEKSFNDAKLKVEYVASEEQGIKKLFANRVQLVASDELVAWALIKRLYPQEISQFATMDKPMNQDKLRLMISKKFPNADELTKKFNAALESIRKKGILSQILAEHGMKE